MFWSDVTNVWSYLTTPYPVLDERATVDEMLTREESDALKTIANRVSAMYADWPAIKTAVINLEIKAAEHERRIVRLENRAPSDPPGSYRISESPSGVHAIITDDHGRTKVINAGDPVALRKALRKESDADLGREIRNVVRRSISHIIVGVMAGGATVLWHYFLAKP